MQMRKSLFVVVLGAFLFGLGSAHAISFNFGDDYWGPGYWGPGYGAPGYGAPGYGGYYPPPRLRSHDRQVMKMQRQSMMSDHDDALEDLFEMLYEGRGFDRTEAVKLAREIEVGAGVNMLRDFHPGSVVTDGSHAAPSVYGEPEAFKVNAEALKGAAAELAEALAVKPTEGLAVFLTRKNAVFECQLGDRECAKEPIDPKVWEKFNALSSTCNACHSKFRGLGSW